jgi:hypothetical protein
MTEAELRQKFPRCSQSFLNQNAAIITLLNDKNAPDRAQRLGKLLKCRCMTNTEMEFRSILRRRFPDCDIRFESYKLRIADRCHYCPDFAVIHLSGLIDFYECKGAHIWEDSKIKFKAAKEMYPHHKFEMWQCRKGDWRQIL